MSDFQKIDAAKLTDDELVIQSILFGYKHHYPGRIRIQDILDSAFGCDWKRREIITQKIIHYGLANYADSDENDFLISIESANALDSDNPIEYMKKLRDSRQPKTQHLSIGGSVIGSQVGQSSDFGNLESSHDFTNTADADATKKGTSEIKKLTIGQKIYKWTDHKLISLIIGGILGFLANQLLHWLGWIPCQ